MKTNHRQLGGCLLVVVMLTGLGISPAFGDVGLITKEELKAMLDDPGLVILDVRKGKDWTSSEFKIQGANHAKPKAYAEWVSGYPKDKKYVLYCA
jgi:hypothetical protein